MPGFTASEVVPASASDVFEVISNPATHPLWAADDLTLEQTGQRTWRSTARAKGRTFTADLIVTRSDPDAAFEFVARDETGTYRHRIELVPTPDGCRVTRSVAAEQLGLVQLALYWLTLVPVRRPALRRSLSKLAGLFT